MNTVRSLVFLVVLAALAQPVTAQVNAFQAWEDAKVIRRVATVAGKGLPEELLTKMANGVVEELRGKQPGGTFVWAYYTRDEAGRTSDGFALKPRKGEEAPGPVELRGTIGYKVRLAVPSRRYLVARNRGIQLQRALVEYTNEAGERSTQEFPLDTRLEPGKHTDLELTGIAWNPVVRVWGWSDERIGKNATLEIQIFQPKLVDNAKSPYLPAVQNALALPKAIDREDTVEVRRLCDSIVATIERVSPEAAASAASMLSQSATAIDVTPPNAGRRSDPELNRRLQEIEDLLSGTELERREGMEKLRQLVRSTRP
ncbi:MAG: hypothetical protein NDJ92_03225 [Thermoanaerobaculia bacterium]|nr:hypothetical protein [Thermoanaerobaculia bacterium]